MTTLEVLKGARALVAKGWTQYAYVRDKGEHVECCILGAFALVDAPCSVRSAATRRLLDCNNIASALDWNDAPGRTQADVLAAFDAAISLESQP